VAQAMGGQKLVLDRITALNAATMPREQSTADNEQAASSSMDLEKLQAAFDNVYAAVDEIDAFRLKALDAMSKTIDALTTQVGKAQSYLDRTKAGEAAAGSKTGAA